VQKLPHLSRREVGVCGVGGRVSAILPLAGENDDGHDKHAVEGHVQRGSDSWCATDHALRVCPTTFALSTRDRTAAAAEAAVVRRS
jgi:hypothetical protein